ncbi:MAG: DEAD/DEAH box helicase [Clostridiales bacterium]|jgi:ATP-dependent RNA helicase RhlE|nr:DEAD/DEAH box helicase [Clostridiales bacterium]
MEFAQLGLDKRILDAIERKGYTEPSPIQRQAIPPALKGRDILGCAQTGTGKTAAFAMPILQLLDAGVKPGAPPKIRALILTPTRELALQIHDSFKTYGRYLKLKSGVIMGGVSQHLQKETLSRGVDILIATPGRLLDLHAQRLVDLSLLQIFVLDEADRMLDMGFIHDVRRIIALIPQKRQTMFFTATMPPEILKLTEVLLRDPVSIAVTPVSSTVDEITQSVYLTDKLQKPDLLVWFMNKNPDLGTALIFTRTKYGADRLSRRLKQSGIEALAIHGDKSQGQRQFALDSFKAGKTRALVATDIAARGIDIADLSCVINYELPNVPETYVHRIGRTGRAGKSGVAVSFCDFDEKEYLRDIEKLIKKTIPQIDSHPYPMTVFVKSPPKVQTPRPPRGERAPQSGSQSRQSGPFGRRR